MRLALVTTLLLLGCRTPGLFTIEHPSNDTLRQTTQGPVIGGDGRYGSHAWLGVPFAAPPVGALRWRAPQPPTPWSGTREATSFGAACPQQGSALSNSAGQAIAGDEDCLTLSLWAPPVKPAEVATSKLPVMVWIHGGGNSIGTVSFYDGGRLATEQHALVIGVQYRLGPLGWFRQAALRDGADELDASGNFGTLDLVRALQWVRDNARAFGGDPDNVTIFGESAGGLNTYTLLLSPLAKGLFHHAIVESGGLWSEDPAAAEAPLADGGHKNSSTEVIVRLLVNAGKAPDEAHARQVLSSMPHAELASWLRSLSASAILAGYGNGRALGMLDAPLVFSEGTVLPKGDWLESLSKPDGWNRVPVIIGTNRDEMRLFLFLDPKRTHKSLGLFPRLNDEANFTATADAMSRFWKLNGVDKPLAAMASSGATELYAYRWDWHDEPTRAGSDLSVILGAGHGLEVPFVFGHFQMGPLNTIFTAENEAQREAVSSAMRSAWGSFATSGAPGGTWARWTPAEHQDLVFDVVANGGVRMKPIAEDADRIIAELLADPRLTTPKARCEVLHDLALWGRAVGRAAYDAQAACKDLPFDAYPW
jgi:para-nitrobenzyl esterase